MKFTDKDIMNWALKEVGVDKENALELMEQEGFLERENSEVKENKSGN